MTRTTIARRVFVLAVTLIAAGTLSAQVTFDAGGSIRNVTGFESVNGFVQKDRVAAWLELRGARTLFELSGAYDLSVSGSTATHLADVDKLLLTSTVTGDGAPLSRFELSLGRQRVTDHTGLVLNRALDGLSVSVGYPDATVTAIVGTTFLPNKGSAPVLLSVADAVDYGNTAVLLASPRVVGLVEVVFPHVLRQRVTLSFAMQEDLRGLFSREGLADLFAQRAGVLAEGTETQTPSQGGLVDTQYSSVGVRGNITGGLFYDVFGTLNTGRTLSYVTPEGSSQGSYVYTPMYGVLAGGGVTLALPQVLGMTAGARFVYSTGDDWTERSSVLESSITASPNLFLPITAAPVAPVLRATLGNLAFAELTYGMRPFASSGVDLLERFSVGVAGLVYLRPAAGALSVATPNTSADTSPYLGAEADLRVSWQPLSDLVVEVLGGVFLPNSAETSALAGETARWRAEATVSLSL